MAFLHILVFDTLIDNLCPVFKGKYLNFSTFINLNIINLHLRLPTTLKEICKIVGFDVDSLFNRHLQQYFDESFSFNGHF